MKIKMTTPGLLLLALSLILTACASDTKSRVVSAATMPLSDLNIVKAEIPAVLRKSAKAPYQIPVDQTCTGIALEIHKLDEVLGADINTPVTETNPPLIEWGMESVNDATLGTIQHSAEAVIPFRGWVRKLSGAERYSKDVSAAIAAGSIRRAFLKGVGSSHGCHWDAPQTVTSAKSK
jgi:hypothetical protein